MTTSVIVFKQIKAGKLNYPKMVDEIVKEALSVSKDMELDFVLTTGTWKTNVKFDRLVDVSDRGVEILVGTDNLIYDYVSKGTKRHLIRVRRARFLRFNSQFSPKSMPGVIASMPGFSGGDVVYRKQVMHPGSKARNFDKAIAKKWQPLLRRRLEKAMARAVKAGGHAMK